MSKLLPLFLLLFSISCTSLNEGKGFGKRHLETFYRDSGTTRYFLSSLPEWANYSENGRCQKRRNIRFLNFKSIKSSFALNYVEMLHLQHIYNVDYWNLVDSHEDIKSIPLNVEERIFFSAHDKVQNKLNYFKGPKFKKVNLIWIDEAISGKDSKLKALLSAEEAFSGFPIFISLCRSEGDIRNFLGKMNIDIGSFKVIPFEMFTPFDNKGSLNYGLRLDFIELIGVDKEINLYLPKGEFPTEFVGDVQIKYY